MRRFLALTLTAALQATPASGIVLPDDFTEEVVLTGMNQPISFRFVSKDRILVAEQKTGRVRLFLQGAVASVDPVLTVPNLQTDHNEQGLLSIALDPQWPARNFLYAYYDYDDGSTADVRLTRYTATGDLSGDGDGIVTFEVSSALHVIVGIPDEFGNHNGGDLRFGPDGMLYLSPGDDEGGRCQAQNVDSLLGKVLRIDVRGLSAGATGVVDAADITPPDNPYVGQGERAGLVWTLGLRNPFRMHVDPLDGSVFVGDVGWTKAEEVDHVEGPGVNLGWPYREGTLSGHSNLDPCPEPAGFSSQPPIDQYLHSAFPGALSVMSGPVYRVTPQAPRRWPLEYRGDYFYAEHFYAWLVRLKGSGQSWSVASAVPGQADARFWATDLASFPVDFQVGADGSLYYLSLGTGSLRRIVYTGEVPPLPTEKTSLGAWKSRW
jgi:glucose/arabinose dehydrogenase